MFRTLCGSLYVDVFAKKTLKKLNDFDAHHLFFYSKLG